MLPHSKMRSLLAPFFIALLVLCIARARGVGAAPPPLSKRFLHGPLYDGIGQLVDDEQYIAYIICEQTLQQINATANWLLDGLSEAHAANRVVGHIMVQLQKLGDKESLLRCFKDSEQDIAHFNRELVYKFQDCSQNLQASLDRLWSETADKVAYMKGAEAQIAMVPAECHVKSMTTEHSQTDVIMCVATELGKINQSLHEASDLCIDVLADISLASEEDSDASCRNYIDLQQQFLAIYEDIEQCLEQ